MKVSTLPAEHVQPRQLQVWQDDELVGYLATSAYPSQGGNYILISDGEKLYKLKVRERKVVIPAADLNLAGCSAGEQERLIMRLRETHSVPADVPLDYNHELKGFVFAWPVIQVDIAGHELLFDMDIFQPA